MKYTNIINENLINLNLKGVTKYSVIEELVEMIDKEKRIKSKEDFIDSVIKREEIMSTFCGFQIAMPHGISDTVILPTLCIGKVSGFLWDEDEDDTYVKYIFLIAIPEENIKIDIMNSEYSDTISQILKIILFDSYRKVLFESNKPEDILKLIQFVIK